MQRTLTPSSVSARIERACIPRSRPFTTRGTRQMTATSAIQVRCLCVGSNAIDKLICILRKNKTCRTRISFYVFEQLQAPSISRRDYFLLLTSSIAVFAASDAVNAQGNVNKVSEMSFLGCHFLSGTPSARLLLLSPKQEHLGKAE